MLMAGQPEDTNLVYAKEAVSSVYIHGNTIIYRSNLENNKWTKSIDDILEIRDGELPAEEAAKLFKKYLST